MSRAQAFLFFTMPNFPARREGKAIMPITSIASHGPTMEAFNINWTQANSELGATPLTLAGGYTRALFETNSQNVLAAIEDVQAKTDEARAAATARDSAKLALLTRSGFARQ
jgi:hypothetical protein